MADFFDLNLWMFIVIGIFGYGLCYFRYQLAYWVVPAILLVAITFLINTLPDNLPPLHNLAPLTWVRIGLSIFLAIVLPVAGALADHESQKAKKAKDTGLFPSLPPCI
jgi:hypothetical protein